MENHKGWREPNLSLTGVKRQHYVPQMYLRAFAEGDSIRVCELDDGTEYMTSTKNTAVESYFYNVKIADMQLSVENWLAKLEGRAAPILDTLRSNHECILTLSDEEEIHLARFLAALRLRTLSFRENMNRMNESMFQQIKDMARKQIYHQNDKEKADTIWDEIKNKPMHWWYKELEPTQPEAITAHMLGEVQGFANILRAAPWHLGLAPSSLKLYTSDNPVAGYLTPVRLHGEGAMFSSFTYFVPLSPQILLIIERRPNKKDKEELKPRGERRSREYSKWEISFARHVVTSDAVKYLYGNTTIVPRDCAISCLERINRAKVEFAIQYLGYKPDPI